VSHLYWLILFRLAHLVSLGSSCCLYCTSYTAHLTCCVVQPLGTDNYVPTIMYTFVFGRYSLILSDYRSLSLIIHDFRLHHPILIVDSFGRAIDCQ